MIQESATQRSGPSLPCFAGVVRRSKPSHAEAEGAAPSPSPSNQPAAAAVAADTLAADAPLTTADRVVALCSHLMRQPEATAIGPSDDTVLVHCSAVTTAESASWVRSLFVSGEGEGGFQGGAGAPTAEVRCERRHVRD